jgi:hypothetical protein
MSTVLTTGRAIASSWTNGPGLRSKVPADGDRTVILDRLVVAQMWMLFPLPGAVSRDAGISKAQLEQFTPAKKSMPAVRVTSGPPAWKPRKRKI